MTRGGFVDNSGSFAKLRISIVDEAVTTEALELATNEMGTRTFEAASVFTAGVLTDVEVHVDQAVRKTKSVIVSSQLGELYNHFFASLVPYIASAREEAVKSPAPASFLRYSPGDFFVGHRDVSAKKDASEVATRLTSAVLFVNGATGEPSYEGGELVVFPFEDFGPHGIVIEPKPGRLVMFPSTMFHEVKPVASGDRYTVVTWYHGLDYVAPSLAADSPSTSGR